jgi:hypothetical protein
MGRTKVLGDETPRSRDMVVAEKDEMKTGWAWGVVRCRCWVWGSRGGGERGGR